MRVVNKFFLRLGRMQRRLRRSVRVFVKTNYITLLELTAYPLLSYRLKTPAAYFNYSVGAREIYGEQRTAGVSGYVRLFNEADFCEAAITSHLPFFDELVLVCDSATTDDTPRLARALAERFPDKIKYRLYEPPVLGKLRHRSFQILPEAHPQSLVNFYNYTLSQTTRQVVAKVDGDHIAIESEFARLAEQARDSQLMQDHFLTFTGINLWSYEGAIYVAPDMALLGYEDHGFYMMRRERFYYRKPRTTAGWFEEGEFRKAGRTIRRAGIAYFHLKFMRSNLFTQSYRGLSADKHQKRFTAIVERARRGWLPWAEYVQQYRAAVLEQTGTDLALLPNPNQYLLRYMPNFPTLTADGSGKLTMQSRR